MAELDPIVSLKLFIDPKSQRVIFAEAQKDFVDFVCHILSLPIAALSKLVRHEGAILRNLYDSIENLGTNYIQESQVKTLLNPKAPDYTASVPLSLLDKRTFYRCSICNDSTLYDISYSYCPKCNRCSSMKSLTVAYNPQKQTSNEVGFVKDLVIYMVTDDLVVKPLTTLSTHIDLLHKFDFKHIGQLQQKEVNMGKNEALKILKACMDSKTVLTDVFLKPEIENKDDTVSTKS